MGEGGVVGALEATEGRVADDRDGDEEACRVDVHARQRVDGGRPAKDQHGRDDERREPAEPEEGQVCGRAPADLNDFKHGVDGRALALDFDGDDGEEDDLHRSARRIPEGP